MKNKFKLIMAVLFCSTLFISSCTSDNSTDNKDPVQALLDILDIQGGVGSPSITASADGIMLNLNGTVTANIHDVIDTLLDGAHVSAGNISLRLVPSGPGKLKLEVQIFFPTNSGGTGALPGLIPSATAQPNPYALNVDDRAAVNLFRGKPALQLTAEIAGDNNVTFPYNDNDPLIFRFSGVQDGKWYEVAFPTNNCSGEPCREVAAWIKIENGQIALNMQSASSPFNSVAVAISGPNSVDYTFNGPNSAYYTFSNLTQWHSSHPTWSLPPNSNPKKYYLSVRELSSTQTQKGKAYFNITP